MRRRIQWSLQTVFQRRAAGWSSAAKIHNGSRARKRNLGIPNRSPFKAWKSLRQQIDGCVDWNLDRSIHCEQEPCLISLNWSHLFQLLFNVCARSFYGKDHVDSLLSLLGVEEKKEIWSQDCLILRLFCKVCLWAEESDRVIFQKRVDLHSLHTHTHTHHNP